MLIALMLAKSDCDLLLLLLLLVVVVVVVVVVVLGLLPRWHFARKNGLDLCQRPIDIRCAQQPSRRGDGQRGGGVSVTLQWMNC